MRREEDHPEEPIASAWRLECRVHFTRSADGRKHLAAGEDPPPAGLGTVPRVARLLALAHRFDGLLRSGQIRDSADLAHLADISRARVTQIMKLLYLAPLIQEAVLDLPTTTKGRDPISERDLRPITAIPEWPTQRRLWASLWERRGLSSPEEKIRVRRKTCLAKRRQLTAFSSRDAP